MVTSRRWGRNRGISLYDWLLENHPSGVEPSGGPWSFVVLLSVSNSVPWSSLQKHVGTTAKIKPSEAVPTLGRIPVHEICPRPEMCSFFQRWEGQHKNLAQDQTLKRSLRLWDSGSSSLPSGISKIEDKDFLLVPGCTF